MGFTEWLLGDREYRSYTLTLETAIAIAHRLRNERPQADVQWWLSGPDGERKIRESELPQLLDADLGRLELRAPETVPMEGHDPVFGISVISFRLNAAPRWEIVQDYNQDLTRALKRMAAEAGRVRLMPHPFDARAFLEAVPVLAFAAVMMWLQLTTPLPIPAIAAGWLIVIIAITVAAPRYRAAKARMGKPERLLRTWPGHRIIRDTRDERAQRRANTRRDILVAVLTAVLTLAATITAALVTGILQL